MQGRTKLFKRLEIEKVTENDIEIYNKKYFEDLASPSKEVSNLDHIEEIKLDDID